jgi:hypothetical protein
MNALLAAAIAKRLADPLERVEAEALTHRWYAATTKKSA